MAIIQDALNDPTSQALKAAAASAQPGSTASPASTSTPEARSGMQVTPQQASPNSNLLASSGAPQSPGMTLQPDQSVEGRIASIVNSNSPIIQMARTKALETANGRGLLNSSMAAQAGEAAAFQAATPMAQSDVSAQTQLTSTGMNNQTQLATTGMNNENQRQLQQMQNENSKLLQTNNQAATAFNQAQVAIAQIEQNDRMDAQAKTQAIAEIQSNLQTQLKTLQATAGLDLGSQLMFARYPGFDEQGNWVGFQGAAPAAGAAGAPPATVTSPWGSTVPADGPWLRPESA